MPFLVALLLSGLAACPVGAAARRLQATAEAPSPSSTAIAPADWCNQCGNVTDYNPVCGVDSQTYGNDCVPSCLNVKIAHTGKCPTACYPPGASVEGDWSSTQPYCVVGLTFRNLAEATYSWSAAAGNTEMPSTSSAPYDYVEALAKVLIYWDAQISGKIEPQAQRLDWRGDSCLSCKGSHGEDLSGGYYESGGSTMKMSVVHNFHTSIMAWAGLAFKQGFVATKTLEELMWKVKHSADFLLNSYVSENPPIFMASYGNSTQDFDNFSPLELFEEYVPPRPAGYLTEGDPGSEATGGAAAALAAASLLLKDDLPHWSANALAKARSLYTFASTNPKSFMQSSDPVVLNMGQLYSSDGNYADELAWAAAWLYKATGEDSYLQAASSWFGQTSFHYTLEVWNYYAADAVLLSQLDTSNSAYSSAAKQFFDTYLGGSIGYTDAGTVYAYHWSSNAQVGNVAFLAAAHANNTAVIDTSYAARLLNFGHFQTDYLLGDAGRSWIIGFGNDYPTYVWHKPSYFSVSTWTSAMGDLIWTGRDIGPWSSKKTGTNKFLQRGQMVMEASLQPNPHILYGGVWASPLRDDGMIASRKDYTYAEPANPTNTAIVGALAHMVEYFGLSGPYYEDMQEVKEVDYADLLTDI